MSPVTTVRYIDVARDLLERVVLAAEPVEQLTRVVEIARRGHHRHATISGSGSIGSQRPLRIER